MIHEANLPKYFWNYVVHYAVFVMNRCESSVLPEGMTSAMYAYGNTSLKRLKFFGCAAFGLDMEPNNKMSKRSKMKFFLGVSEGNYLLWDSKDNTVKAERNIEFDETWIYKDEIGKQKIQISLYLSLIHI